MSKSALKVTAIPAFSDNYVWLLETGGNCCAVVDPGEHRPVIGVLEERGLQLDTVLLTHHHADHIGGVAGLLERWNARVIGPDDPRIPDRDLVVGQGDRVELPALGLEFEVLEVPGHTRSHIAYHGHESLFCGDTLFSAGCGRLFEGTPEQMQVSLDKLARLPGSTRVYCAHEYTLSNCDFALQVEPDNEQLRAFAEDTRRKREQDRITLPSSLAEEREVNPFLRTREDTVVRAAREADPSATPGASTLAVIRAWKDRF